MLCTLYAYNACTTVRKYDGEHTLKHKTKYLFYARPSRATNAVAETNDDAARTIDMQVGSAAIAVLAGRDAHVPYM